MFVGETDTISTLRYENGNSEACEFSFYSLPWDTL